MQMPDKKTWPFIAAALVLGASLSGFVGYVFWNQYRIKLNDANAVNQELRDSFKSLSDYYSQQAQRTPTTPEPAPNDQINGGTPETPKELHDIVWANKATLLKSDEVDFYIKNTIPDTSNYAPVKETEAIVIGKVTSTSTAYPDWSVLRALAYDELGMGGGYPIFKLFVLSPDKQVIMPWSGDLPALSETDFPKQLALPNGKIVKRSYYDNSDALYEGGNCLTCAALGESSYIKPLITSKEGIKLFSSAPNQGENALAFDKFGRGVIYYDNLPENGLQNIQWSVTNSSTIQYYAGPIISGGCGGGPVTVTTEQLGPLKIVGTLSNGETIYMPSDLKNNILVKQRYDQWLPYYGNGDGEDEKPSFEEYLRQYPVPFFVRKNAFGAWVTFVSDRSGSMAECGKPVIYLYPEKETNVSVRLPSKINVTVSDPTYPRGGWNVLATPDGSLLYKDGETYGSLFWEGTGVDYSTPKTGFIVKDGEVSNFLTKTLPKYGLNPTEAKEFMDFWVPLFKGAPYYRISFLTDDWSKAAPLNVSPAPRTQIRIFMDWSPLAGLIEIPEPTITTPSRNGFTLVEWGGLLRK